LVISRITPNSPSIVKEGILFIVEEGTESHTTQSGYTETILRNNVNRIVDGLNDSASKTLLESLKKTHFDRFGNIKEAHFGLMNS
jgi:hypothetical protein